MARNITIEFNPTGFTHDVYTGVTSGMTNGIVCQNATTGCTFSIDDSYVSLSGDTIWTKITCDGCKDQYYPIKLASETCAICDLEIVLLNCGTLEGYIEKICNCPPGYDVTLDRLSCVRIFTTGYTTVSTDMPAPGGTDPAYGTNGFLIYNVNDYDTSGDVITNYAYNGGYFGLDSNMSPRDLFWANRMNYIGIWKQGEPRYIGVLSFCTTINAPTTKTYYVGIGGDNGNSFKINGTTIVQQPLNQLSDFQYWHIYPVTLNAGLNLIEISNQNTGGPGNFSGEIYNNTLSELTGATGTSQLNVVFSTGDYLPARSVSGITTSGYRYIENTLQGNLYGQGFCTNYYCPPGYTLDTTNPLSPVCKLIEYTSCT